MDEERTNKVLENIPDDRREEFFASLENVFNHRTYTEDRKQYAICRIVSEWEKEIIGKGKQTGPGIE